MTARRTRTRATARPEAARARLVVVKVGSGVLSANGALRTRAFGDIARQVSTLREEGRDVLVVSSGAIAVGTRELGWSEPGSSIPEKQAAAAVGQIGLGELYKKRFARHDVTVAQVLVTRAGLDDRERFLNARHTLRKLLELGVVPIINENDTVATEEIRFGDNDNLSATVVNLVAAELLVILTDVDGMYHEAPREGQPKPALFDVVDKITPSIERAAQGSASAFGRGGMTTKLEAARAAARSGAATVLCNGLARDSLLAACRGDAIGTLFRSGDRMQSRKHWLAFTARVRGKLHVDAGAARALVKGGKSLLPAGITRVSGRFNIGDPVSCVGPDGASVARGLVAYSSEEIKRIAGQSASKISTLLGYSNGDAVIHRNDLVLREPL
ncbi:MAG: glutamate 5-kinase [Deltaproteobacteria bacterium]|nr:glutamate 5-kinase [Deltaproteobacteria bacterium]